MISIHSMPVAALLLCVACRMDNPAFEGGDELAGTDESSTQSDTSATTQAEVGESGTADSSTAPETSGETADTIGSECDPADPNSCGECFACSNAGQCVVTPGVACEGNVLQCAEYAFGYNEGICYALAAAELGPKCSEAGECKQPSAAACPQTKGEDVLACDLSCVTNPDACAPLQWIGQLATSDMCKVDGETDACGAHCSPLEEIVKSSCVEGWCQVQVVEGCGAYACNPLTADCYFGCELDIECGLDFMCDIDSNTCVPWLP